MQKKNYKPHKRIIKWIGMPLAVILFLFCGVYLFAAVDTVKSTTTDSNAIYVVGNPDFYPVEYYDYCDVQYKGVMPEILKRISEKTGLDFVYIAAGEEDQRFDVASSGQAILVSGLLKDQEDIKQAGIKLSEVIFEMEIDGEIREICFGYSKAAGQEFIDAFEKALSDISDEEILRTALSYVAYNGRTNFPVVLHGIAFTIGILLLSSLVILSLTLHDKHKRLYEGKTIDSVTGIEKKEYFHQVLRPILKDSAGYSYAIAYIGFDIVRVNRYYGYDESENILIFAAKKLTEMSSASDIVARIGGGSFAVAHICEEEEIDGWISEILYELNRYGEKFGKDFRPRFYSGIYRIKNTDRDVSTVIANAQHGYLQAVEKNVPYMISDTELLDMITEDNRLKKDSIDALTKNQFKMYVQFIVDRSRNIVGGEVLSRWEHPLKGLLMPTKYIEIMEHEGTVFELDLYMFEKTCKQLAEWKEKGIDIVLSSNFDRTTIDNPNFMSRIKEIVERYDFDPKNFILEITENSLEKDKKTAYENISFCKSLGFGIALDDVGSGYTSFSDFRDYPVDVMKISRVIISGATDPSGVALLQSIIRLAHNLNIQVLCEGVETEEQFELLKELGCSFYQGYFFYKHMPVEEARRIVQKNYKPLEIRLG
ncbi:MAG: EAL domain-containing protein [Clostridiaceae bacterium]|jgi:EAL domain-containing protein (putative c-di-GMP-specific phosphodiesterase class I)/GGDEF domain-containing protein|nr:EAL domain-containing protein [Clostridiaceae bacterium]